VVSYADTQELLTALLALMAQVRQALFLGVDGERVRVSQYRVLRCLKQGDASMSNLTEHSAVTMPTMTKLIDLLARRGWVRRYRSEDDRRRVYISLTDAGAAALATLEERACKALEDTLTHLSGEEAELMSRAAQILEAAARGKEYGFCLPAMEGREAEKEG